jgi:hypothetical protein
LQHYVEALAVLVWEAFATGRCPGEARHAGSRFSPINFR